MVQPDGMPEAPVGQSFIPVALMNVPEEATPSSQPVVQESADISVARHSILLSEVQPENMLS